MHRHCDLIGSFRLPMNECRLSSRVESEHRAKDLQRYHHRHFFSIEMDSLCQRIDRLTIEYLNEFGHLLACKQLIDDTVKQGYFNLSRARIIMGVHNLSRLQYSENQPMIAATKISVENDEKLTIEKQLDPENGDDPLKWFGLLHPKVLKQSQKSFQQTIDLIIEACQRQDQILRLKSQIEQLMKEKKILLCKENVQENKLID